jgi:hypothetical protein
VPLFIAELVLVIILWAGLLNSRLKEQLLRHATPIVMVNLSMLLLVWVERLLTGTLPPG